MNSRLHKNLFIFEVTHQTVCKHYTIRLLLIKNDIINDY